jgi:hypothetical protein
LVSGETPTWGFRGNSYLNFGAKPIIATGPGPGSHQICAVGVRGRTPEREEQQILESDYLVSSVVDLEYHIHKPSTSTKLG